MGAILNSMGYPYRSLSINDLNNAQTMANIHILFINCAGPEPTWQAANNIRELVDNGGALYVSCYARKWIDMIFPDKMEFHSEGEIQSELHARVIDSGLREFLGGIRELYLNYNTHWAGISKIKVRDGPYAVKEYMRGKRQGWWEEEPLLISFQYGEGFVIFTTFHNSHQVNELEFRLLQYLVLKPLMARRSTESNTIMQQRSFTPTKEILGALSVGQSSPHYEFSNERIRDLKFIFNWEGRAVARLNIYAPDGSVILNQNARESPVSFDVEAAKPGVWKFQLSIVDAPFQNFPFVIHVGMKEILDLEMRKYASDNDTQSQTEDSIKQSAPGSKLDGDSFSFPSPYNTIDFQQYHPPRTYTSTAHQQEMEDETIVSLSSDRRSGSLLGIRKESQNIQTLEELPRTNSEDTIAIVFEMLVPFRNIIGQYAFRLGQKVRFGRDVFVNYLSGEELNGIMPDHIELQLLDDHQMILKALSENSAAQHFSQEEINPVKLIKGIGVAYTFPIIIQLGDELMVGIYKK